MPTRPRSGGARPLAVVAIAVLALAVAALVAAAAVGSIFLTSAVDAWEAIAAPGPAGPADGILLVVALSGAALSLWLGLGTILSAMSALPGALGQACNRLAARIAPAAVRKVVAFVLGTALTAALVPGTAMARTGQDSQRPAVVAAAPQVVDVAADLADAAPDASFRFVGSGLGDGGDVGDVGDVGGGDVGGGDVGGGDLGGRNGVDGRDAAPSPSWSAVRKPTPRATTSSPRTPATMHRPLAPIELFGRDATPDESSAPDLAQVVVLRGDSLWSIAARHLGPAATSAQIDAEWRRWFAANRSVIGGDANVIAPGQLLRPPATGRANR